MKIITLIYCTLTLLISAQTFESKDDFSIKLPNTWAEIPSNVLSDYSKAIALNAPNLPKQVFNYGYQLKSDQWFTYPYILVQVKNVGRIPSGELKRYKKLKREMEKGLDKASESMSDLVSNSMIGEPVYDDVNHILWTTLTMQVAGIGPVKGLMATKLTEKGIIQFNGYSTADSYDKNAKLFRETFIKNLTISPSIAYSPKLTDNAPTIFGINLGVVIQAAIVGAIIGLIVTVIKKSENKRKNS